MTISYMGSLTLGQAIPMAETATVELDTSLGLVLPDVQSRVTGLLALSIAPAPSLQALIDSATAMLAALEALLVAPLPDADATAAALLDLQTTLGAITTSLDFSAGLGSLLGTAGIHYYVFAGAANELSGQLGSLLSGGLPGGTGGAEHIAGSVLLANDGGAITALQTVLAT